MKRIICVGNKYLNIDTAGPRVYERLAQMALPEDVELIDGGLAGLNLLGLVEKTERVIFVDAVVGVAQPGSIVALEAAEAALGQGSRYDHAAGLGYLLRVLPSVCEGPLPEVLLVGLEGPTGDKAIAAAAALSVKLAVEGRQQHHLPELAPAGEVKHG